MKFALKSLNGLILASVLATAGVGAIAQGTDAAPAALKPISANDAIVPTPAFT